MKDINDKDTHDAFISFEELDRQDKVANCLATGGHYQSVPKNQFFAVTGNRFAGSKTPDNFRDKWRTPPEIIDWLERRYRNFDLDAAASESNRVCEKFYDEKTNCLKRWWGKGKHVFLNPPYSNPDPFVLKAVEQMEHGNQIDILLNADNSTAWFRDAQKNAAEIIFIVADVDEVNQTSRTGRLSFISEETGLATQGNNKGSVIFIMRELMEGEKQETHYVSVTEIFPSLLNKKAKKRSGI